MSRSEDVKTIRRAIEVRNREEREVAFIENCFTVAMLLILVAFIGWCVWRHHRQPIEERAAYLEGRYELDHATAMKYAAEGRGLTAEELLATK